MLNLLQFQIDAALFLKQAMKKSFLKSVDYIPLLLLFIHFEIQKNKIFIVLPESP